MNRTEFPVRFKQDLSSLPMFAYGLKKMIFSKYPAIRRVIGWNLKPDERHKMGELLDNKFENDRLSIWSWR